MFQRFILQCLKVLCWVIGHIPLDLYLWFGRMLGRLGFYMDKKHRKIALNNLNTAFGQEKSDDKMDLTAKKVFENLGMNFMEFFRLPWLKKGDLTGYVECEGFENFKRAAL